MIEVKNLCAGYRGEDVLRGVTLAFRPGEVLALLGPNGCGKSTLLKAALGMIDKAGGEVLLNGVPLEKLSRREIAQSAAFLTQSRNTPVISALRMVLHGRFPYLSYPRRYGKADVAIARSALARVGAAQHEDRNVGELSGGQRQGVYLAMALAQQTQTIFMDEPTTYLDIAHQLALMETAHALAREGRAVVLVLHDIPLALRTADRIAVMQDGCVAACGTPEEIKASRVIDRVFHVALHAADTPHGRQYYCVPLQEDT